MRRARKPTRSMLRTNRIASEDANMCLTCGCMDAHREMGEANITYEDIKRAADENGRSVAETLQIFDRTEPKDRGEHAREYAGTGAPTA